MAAVSAAAQPSLSMSLAPAAIPAGGQSTISVTYLDTPTPTNLAAFQWQFSVPPGTTIGAPTVGPMTATASAATATINNNPIPSGSVATFPLTVAAGTAPGSYPLTLTPVLGASQAGLLVAMTATGANLVVLSKYDLNGDGLVNSADITIARDQATGAAPCTTGDVNGDGKCNVVDVTLEILAALGIIH